jgi:hypothetical protein
MKDDDALPSHTVLHVTSDAYAFDGHSSALFCLLTLGR